MQTCPNCGKENPSSETYCYACGHILPAGLGELSTQRLEDPYKALEPRRRWGTAYFDQNSRLQLSMRDAGEEIVVVVGNGLVLGRFSDEVPPQVRALDLTPYGAVEQGVSRRHLEITRQHDTIFVTDLGSANSTYLNGQRLIPREARILRDNDELRLGRLVIRVAFV
ncbi:FHA domain-containing protein [Aggregatilinea lenta]|uniref:FHA domain-containing protein n=1 Tax=Aggregatilinea lenta TaxID=913108 RepID=UPI000E5B3EAE|nr:FHA domain-containing protein [Aggregatilinea lenta]